jgi:hypothetical protein
MNTERIRELCARAVKTEGAEFQSALAELADAIDNWKSDDYTYDSKKCEKALRSTSN